MRQNQFNKHGQPFSRKQKKASRTMMALKSGKPNRDPGGGLRIDTSAGIGVEHSIIATFFTMMRRFGRGRSKG